MREAVLYAQDPKMSLFGPRRGGFVVARTVVGDGEGKHVSLEIADALEFSLMTDFHDRFLIIDNIELHGPGSSINCLGRRVTSYTTRNRPKYGTILEF